MSISHIPDKVKYELWAKTAGRCGYDGCNKILWSDIVTKRNFNTAYIAHIIADRADGPRGDLLLSEQLKDDISNLILLCDTHHRLVDIDDVKGHSVELLQGMKKLHEERIQRQTNLGPDKQSFVLLYGSNIGRHNTFLSWVKSYHAMSPNKYPAENTAIELGLKNSAIQDRDGEYWQIEQENLLRQFNIRVIPRLVSEINHLSVFAIAPQPLLIELGRLLSDVNSIEVYQHQKEPEDSWKWQDSEISIDYEIIRPTEKYDTVALNVSLSANIDNNRITTVIGENASIWKIRIPNPNNDFLKTRKQLSDFRVIYRRLLDEIKLFHGQNATLNIFPAAPVSVAVEMGRVWMPKADLPLRVYDQNSALGGFIFALEIKS